MATFAKEWATHSWLQKKFLKCLYFAASLFCKAFADDLYSSDPCLMTMTIYFVSRQQACEYLHIHSSLYFILILSLISLAKYNRSLVGVQNIYG
jgi:hypothetical protein